MSQHLKVNETAASFAVQLMDKLYGMGRFTDEEKAAGRRAIYSDEALALLRNLAREVEQTARDLGALVMARIESFRAGGGA
jgi:hypothetical protein